MREFISHFFIPRESNNHRAKILHHSNISLVIFFLLISSLFFNQLKTAFPSVLGIRVDISTEELLDLTNQKRQENGASSLFFSEKLSEAAAKKAEDMFAYDYWAHNSPTGKTPWVFIRGAGYEYVYAGENLAKGFSSAQDVIDAWMASPDHRANMLSSNYRDVGFAVKIGILNGEETVLIVEEFGNPNFPIAKNTPAQEVATSSDKNINAARDMEPLMELGRNISVNSSPLIDVSALALNTNFLIISLFIFILFLDMLIIEKKKIMRFVGHNMDHVFYLLLILSLAGVLSRGIII